MKNMRLKNIFFISAAIFFYIYNVFAIYRPVDDPYFRKGYRPMENINLSKCINYCDSLGGVGFGKDEKEADNNALISLCKSMGVNIEISSYNKISEKNGVLNEEYGQSTVIQNIYKKIHNTHSRTEPILINGEIIYKVTRWIYPRKYVAERLPENVIHEIDSLCYMATIELNTFAKYFMHEDLFTKPIKELGQIKEYNKLAENFRLPYFYNAYCLLDDDLLMYLFPELQKVKEKIKNLALKRQENYEIYFHGEDTKGWEFQTFTNYGLNILYLEFGFNGEYWSDAYYREDPSTNHIYIQNWTIEGLINKSHFSEDDIEKEILFRTPFLHVKKDGTVGVREDIPDDWYAIKKITQVPYKKK